MRIIQKNKVRIFKSIAKFETEAKMFLRKFLAMLKNPKNEFHMSKKMIQLPFHFNCKFGRCYSFILHINKKSNNSINDF